MRHMVGFLSGVSLHNGSLFPASISLSTPCADGYLVMIEVHNTVL